MKQFLTAKPAKSRILKKFDFRCFYGVRVINMEFFPELLKCFEKWN